MINGAKFNVEFYDNDSIVIRNWMNQNVDLCMTYNESGIIKAVNNPNGTPSYWAYADNSYYAYFACLAYNSQNCWYSANAKELYLQISWGTSWDNYNLSWAEEEQEETEPQLIDSVWATYKDYGTDYINYTDSAWGMVSGAKFKVEFYDNDSIVIRNWMNQNVDLCLSYNEAGYIKAVNNPGSEPSYWAYADNSYWASFACLAYSNSQNCWYSPNTKGLFLLISWGNTWDNYYLTWAEEEEKEDVVPQLVDTVLTTYKDYSADYLNYTDADWGMVIGAQFKVEFYDNDSIIIRNWMNQNVDLSLVYDESGYVKSVCNPGNELSYWAYASDQYWASFACLAYYNSQNCWYSPKSEEIYLMFSWGTTWDNYHLTWKEDTALEEVETSGQAVKVMENGVLYILKNGIRYNALGAIVK